MNSFIGIVAWTGLGFSSHAALGQTPNLDDKINSKTHWYARTHLLIDNKKSYAPNDTDQGLQLETMNLGTFQGRLQLGLLHDVKVTQDLEAQAGLEMLTAAHVQKDVWNQFFESPGYGSFPLAPHNGQHRFRASLASHYHIIETVHLGLETSYEEATQGSTLFRKSHDLETSPLTVEKIYLLKPSVETSLSTADRLEAYTLFFKRLNSISDFDTYQSYGAGRPSYGLTYERNFAELGLNLAAHAFRYELLFNDKSNDFSRTGMSADLRKTLPIKDLSMGLYAAYWLDDFILPQPRTGMCQSEVTEDSSDTKLQLCSRRDQRFSFGASAHYDWTTNSRVSFRYLGARNRNGDLRGLDFDQDTFLFSYTFATEGFQHRPLEDRDLGLEALQLKDGR